MNTRILPMLCAVLSMAVMNGLLSTGGSERAASGHALVSVAHAAEDWKGEFDDVCSKTTDSMDLSREELRTLVQRCERLKPRIVALDESTKKVYLKRLKMCRDLYQFVLDTKAQDVSPPAGGKP
jgi:hypothetical protein